MFNTFWNVLWLIFWGFATVAYLFALFSVVADLFRDRELNGGLKAVWIIFLVFVPFLTVLVYLIFRGRGMAERQAAQVTEAKSTADAYIRDVAGTSPAEDIAKAKQLLDQGAITPAEYDRLKALVLG